jgi:hypothetical protein
MFSKPKSSLSDEAREFVTRLAESDVWILVVGLRGIPTIPSITDPGAFDIIAAHRIDVSEIGDDDAVFPFNYERNGNQALPFFSSEEKVRLFAAANRFSTKPVIFQPYCLLSGFVATPENDFLDLILDPNSPAERNLSRDERLLLRSLTTPT